MKTRTIAAVLAVWLTCGIVSSTSAQDEGNVPPVITDVSWEISRLIILSDLFGFYLPFEAFDPATELAHELEQIRLTITVEDPDFAGDGDDEVFYLRQSWFAPLPGYPAPEPNPIPEDMFAFFPEEGDGFAPAVAGSTTLTITDIFTVPEWLGRNQARLEGFIDWDVRWIMRVFVSNEQDPDCTLAGFPAGLLIRCEEPVFLWQELLFAVEHPGLAESNPPPFADAGPDQIVEPGTITLDASRTFDGSNVGFDFTNPNIFEKDVLSYGWEWISGPVRVEPTQADPTDETATVVLTELGTYVYRVTVDDNVNSLPSLDSVSVVVVSEIPENRPPRAVITGSVSPIVAGSIITLSGSSSSDPDNDTLTYRWRQTDELGTTLTDREDVTRFFQPLSGVESSMVTWQATDAGEFFFRLIVSDGEIVDSTTVAIEVVAAPVAGVQATAGNASPTDAAAGDGSTQDAPTLAPACGGSLLPLGLLPLLFLMRGRNR